ncbi:hypothetical protein K9M16_05040 [Candidatus Babeliales bacterium]|nr:hypothetical protein [Candidatus Babeliales bacterium]
MLNKKASKSNSFWWIFLFGIVAIVFAGGISWFYSTNFDMRFLESEIISDKIYTCISEEGFLVEDFFSESFSIFNRCGLDREILDKSGNYFIKISSFSEAEIYEEEKKFGDYSYEKICNKIKQGVRFSDENSIDCFYFSNPVLYYNSGNLETLDIEILIAIKGNSGGFVL